MTTILADPAARALIFDLDGTLADTMPIHHIAWRETFAAYGLACPQSFLERMAGMSTYATVLRFNETFGASIEAEEFARSKELMARSRLAQAKPIVPVTSLVERLRGILPMAVATSGVRANVDVILSAIGLADAFDAVVTADDVSRLKPAPDVFLEAARRLAVPPQVCQVLEDSDAGLIAGRCAGMIVTDVRPYINGKA